MEGVGIGMGGGVDRGERGRNSRQEWKGKRGGIGRAHSGAASSTALRRHCPCISSSALPAACRRAVHEP